MIKNAHNLSVEKILGKNDNNTEVYYKIPPYQREYAWGKDQWEKLFDDILENDIGYFLGSIICIDNDPEDVIDGQQRLTTISILLNALLFIINEYNLNYPEENILDFIKNEKNVLAYGSMRKLIFSEKQKLTLSIQNNNNEDYEYVLYSNKLLETKSKPGNFGNRRVSKSLEYFKMRLSEVDKEDYLIFQIDDLFIYLNKVLSSLMVKIEVDDISSAFTLFESINNRGIPLTPIDLIKNSIIGRMQKDLDENPETTNTIWQNIVNNIESYDDQVRFLRHFYHAFQNNPKIKLESYKKATKSNIIKIYSEHINKDVKYIFDELVSKSDTYNILVHPDDIDMDSEKKIFKDKLVDLRRLGVAPSYSLLLFLFDKNVSKLSEILNFIENWFLRRNLTDYPGTNKLDQIFLDLINIVSVVSDEEIFVKIKDYLLNQERYMEDDEFKVFLESKNLYTENITATRCLLTKLERSKRTRENQTDFWRLSDKAKLVWTIEHILPQNPNEKSDWLEIFHSEDKIKEYVHKLGNLTLTCYNSKMSNKSFENKTKIVEDGNDVGLKSGNVMINNYLKDKNQWNVKCIKERGSLLSQDIIDLLIVT